MLTEDIIQYCLYGVLIIIGCFNIASNNGLIQLEPSILNLSTINNPKLSISIFMRILRQVSTYSSAFLLSLHAHISSTIPTAKIKILN